MSMTNHGSMQSDVIAAIGRAGSVRQLKTSTPPAMFHIRKFLSRQFPTRHVERACSNEWALQGDQGEWIERSQESLGCGGLVVMSGDRGVGKTLVATVIARNWCQCGHNYAEGKVRYWRITDLYGEQKAWFDRKFDGCGNAIVAPLEQARQCGLLIVDEIHEKLSSDYERSELTRLIDYRYGELKPTLLLTNCKPANFAEVIGYSAVDRIRDRGRVIRCEGKNQRTQHAPFTATKGV